MTLHVPPGSPETEEAGAGKPSFRIFILGARSESSLPAHVWEQLSLLFPSVSIQLHFVGPQVSLPKSLANQSGFNGQPSSQSTSESNGTQTPPPKEEEVSSQTQDLSAATEEDQKSYVPNVYQPPTPAPIPVLKNTRSSIDIYGAPSYTVPYAYQLSITGIQALYSVIHEQFAETFDPYTDCFFLFSPASALNACVAGYSAMGTNTLRGTSLPLDAIFGVPIWRDSDTLYCVSMRWSASSGQHIGNVTDMHQQDE